MNMLDACCKEGEYGLIVVSLLLLATLCILWGIIFSMTIIRPDSMLLVIRPLVSPDQVYICASLLLRYCRFFASNEAVEQCKAKQLSFNSS